MRGAGIFHHSFKRGLVVALFLAAGGAAADRARHIGGHQDWSLFSDYDLCWSATTSLDDQKTIMMSAFKVKGGVEFSFSFSHPAPVGEFALTVGQEVLSGFARDSNGWLLGAEQDNALHAAMVSNDSLVLILDDGERKRRFSARGYRWLMDAAPAMCLQPVS